MPRKAHPLTRNPGPYKPEQTIPAQNSLRTRITWGQCGPFSTLASCITSIEKSFAQGKTSDGFREQQSVALKHIYSGCREAQLSCPRSERLTPESPLIYDILDSSSAHPFQGTLSCPTHPVEMCCGYRIWVCLDDLLCNLCCRTPYNPLQIPANGTVLILGRITEWTEWAQSIFHGGQ